MNGNANADDGNGTNPWGPIGSKKDTSKTPGGFDFGDFGDSGDAVQEPPAEKKKPEEDIWADFAPVSAKDKKKKRKILWRKSPRNLSLSLSLNRYQLLNQHLR